MQEGEVHDGVLDQIRGENDMEHGISRVEADCGNHSNRSIPDRTSLKDLFAGTT